MSDSICIRRFVFHGRVQGVGFRWQCVEMARSLDLQGWVKNHLDGTVEAVVAGSPAKLNQLQSFLMAGPGSIRVDRCNMEEVSITALQREPEGFHAKI